MLSESSPSVREPEQALVGLSCMKTISGVPRQVPATLFDTGSHISKHLCHTEISSLTGLQAQVTTPGFKVDPGESKLRPHTFRASTLLTETSPHSEHIFTD